MAPRRPKGFMPRTVANERGAVMALVVLLLISFLGLAALAIDLGLLYVARGEAQRAADAGAHAGATYMIHNINPAEEDIKAEAMRVAQRNLVRGLEVSVDLDENDVEVIWAEDKVRVHVHLTRDRDNPVPTLFARALGINTANVRASAAAKAWPAIAADCILPFAIPDRWCIEGPEGNCLTRSDAGEPDTEWDPDEHHYIAWPQSGHTGYVDEDLGHEIILKPQSPQSTMQPGWYFPFRLDCPGANCYREYIQSCFSGPDDEDWEFGNTQETEPGNMRGPTEQGFDALLDGNNASWPDCSGDEPHTGTPEEIEARTKAVVLFDPRAAPHPQAEKDPDLVAEHNLGARDFVVSGFAAIFIEGIDNDGDVRACFVRKTGVKPAPDDQMGDASPQLQMVRIVE